MKLTPWVVTVHLLGGMLLLAGLVSVATRLSGHRVIEAPISKRRFYVSAVIILAVVQIGLGGWVSTHYAAGACGNTFPLCRGHWMPSVMKWQPLLELSHPAGYTLAGDIFPATALVAIHWLHRCGALCVTLAVALLGSYFFRFGAKVWAYKVWVCLVIQLSLGMGNIYWNLPLPLAVAHNGGAALLLSVLVFIFQRISMDVEMKHSVQSV
jgi:heme a synthase